VTDIVTIDDKLLQKMRQDALEIFHAGIKAVDPAICVPQYCSLKDNLFIVGKKTYNLDHYD
jgi:hypothetical protein